MELGFVESLRRRWEILGIGTTAQEKEDDSAADPSNLIMPGVDQEVVSAEDSTEEETGAEARKEILQGAIVKSVMNSAAQGIHPTSPGATFLTAGKQLSPKSNFSIA
ncbi:hypothetical protein H2248_005008 [Termitomyces sp. 'cryptogamus']|nr:hypothetical protein H2248_005008 [Termitomyces sp. 'cryptogamus']